MYANYYKLTLRDALIYKERLSIIDTTENSYVRDYLFITSNSEK